MTDLDYKVACVDRLAEIMRDKFAEKEPRPSWRESPHSLERYLQWLLEEVVEMMKATPEDVFREAADVANLALIYADVKQRAAGL